ncbi:MAG: hypothetical protein H7Y59_01140 [Anaerolineales bacterium]|nr:hypothetical protein [Anaerolineales bacterium]
MNMVVGLFDRYSKVDWAIEVLEDYGVDSGQVSVVALDRDAINSETIAGIGALTSTSNGGLIGILSSLSAFIVPDFGPVIVTGTLASTLFTTLGTTPTGSNKAGLAGEPLQNTLIILGLSQEDAAFYANCVKQGDILVTVDTDEQNEFRIRAILRGAGGQEKHSYSHTQQTEGSSAFTEAHNAYV